MKLKPFYSLALAVALLVSCDNGQKGTESSIDTETIENSNPHSATENEGVAKLPAIEWDKKKHNFGKVVANQKVKYLFKFTNTGDEKLVLVDSETSCGCTVPKLPEEPIAPGESSEITVEFKTSSEGPFSKEVKIIANTVPKYHILNINGTVIKDDNE